MNKYRRLNQLATYLHDAPLPKPLSQLAFQYQCTEKTVRRDIATLAAEQNAPYFVHDNQVHCDQVKASKLEINGQWLDREELMALFALHHLLDSLTDKALHPELKPFQTRIEQLLGAQQPQLSAEAGSDWIKRIKLIDVAQRPICEQVFETLVKALHHPHAIRIHYWQRRTDKVEIRTLTPLQLVRYKDNWKLDGWCHHKNAHRQFSLDAIKTVEMLDQPATEIDLTQLTDQLQSSYGIFSGQANHTAILAFDPFIARWVKDEQWHPEQQSRWREDGRYELSLPYHHDIELIQDILKYGPQVEVLGPNTLRQKVRDHLHKALEKYED
jgi:predicted DNA-binding transcriptional regulator YafY